LETAKKAVDSQDLQVIRSAADELSKSSHKLAEAMYAKASQQQQASSADNQGKPTNGEAKKEDVVDADFEEVK
jgi:molecular chaperone DnaK